MTINNINGSGGVFFRSTADIERASERIASGLRINNAADDAAGFAIANRLDSESRAFNQSIRNANDGISLLQTASGGFSSITENLQRLRELSLQAANGTLNDEDRSFLDKEAQQLKQEITRTIEDTTFNNKSIYNNTDKVNIQLGAGENDTVKAGVNDFADILTSLNFDDIDLSTASGAASALSTVDDLQTEVDTGSADVGAQINRLDSTINNLYNREENAAASRARIADADYAEEVSELVANNLRQQTTIALQSQANTDRANVLRLLSGL